MTNVVTITKGSREVIITEQGGKFTARLYVNKGDTATLRYTRTKTLAGAERWADAVLTDATLMAPDFVN